MTINLLNPLQYNTSKNVSYQPSFSGVYSEKPGYNNYCDSVSLSFGSKEDKEVDDEESEKDTKETEAESDENKVKDEENNTEADSAESNKLAFVKDFLRSAAGKAKDKVVDTAVGLRKTVEDIGETVDNVNGLVAATSNMSKVKP